MRRTSKKIRPELKIVAINKPDPEIAAAAILPLLRSFLASRSGNLSQEPAESPFAATRRDLPNL
jgi:hypothetical protein